MRAFWGAVMRCMTWAAMVLAALLVILAISLRAQGPATPPVIPDSLKFKITNLRLSLSQIETRFQLLQRQIEAARSAQTELETLQPKYKTTTESLAAAIKDAYTSAKIKEDGDYELNPEDLSWKKKEKKPDIGNGK